MFEAGEVPVDAIDVVDTDAGAGGSGDARSQFAVGDRVEVVDGELKHLTGVCRAVQWVLTLVVVVVRKE